MSRPTSDFTNIATLLGGKPGGPGNVIYDNFQALKQKALVAAQGNTFVSAIHLQCYSGGSGNVKLSERLDQGIQ